MAVRSGSGDDVIIRQTLTEYLKAHARTEMVRAAFEKVLEQHSVAFDKLENHKRVLELTLRDEGVASGQTHGHDS
jgi:hypothetical protein